MQPQEILTKIDWIQIGAVIAVVVSNIGLFIWARSEANADRREFQAQLNAALKAIADEMKDFHGRMCAIEERKKTNA